tara:strand:+ start:1673 stop:1867 length:195 start_codon:yes stop_codon:yes gene_type:complete
MECKVNCTPVLVDSEESLSLECKDCGVSIPHSDATGLHIDEFYAVEWVDHISLGSEGGYVEYKC